MEKLKKKPGLVLPDPCKLSWSTDTHELVKNGKPHRLRGFGAYFDLERDTLDDRFLYEYFWFLYDCGFTMLRVFALSTFNKVRLRSLGLNSWCPWMEVNGKYDLTSINSLYLENLQRITVHAMRWGIAIQLVLFDECGFKVQRDPAIGWNMSPYNKKNVVPGSPGWEYTGSAYFKYHKMWNEDKYPDLRKVTENYVRQFANALSQYPNVIFELINEPSEDIFDFENVVIDWIQDQYLKSGASRFPIIASSGDFLAGKNRIDIKWTHNHLVDKVGYTGYSTDGSRVTEFGGDPIKTYEEKMCHFYFEKHAHIEIHMQFFSTLPGLMTNEIYALTWFDGKKLSDPRTDWVSYLGPYLQINRAIAIESDK